MALIAHRNSLHLRVHFPGVSTSTDEQKVLRPTNSFRKPRMFQKGFRNNFETIAEKERLWLKDPVSACSAQYSNSFMDQVHEGLFFIKYEKVQILFWPSCPINPAKRTNFDKFSSHCLFWVEVSIA